MADEDCMTRLGGWDGYCVERWSREHRGAESWVVIELSPVPGVEHRCSGCGSVVAALHDRTLRRIRDPPVFGESVELRVPRLRLACAHCGPRIEALVWLDRHERVTQRLAQSVARLCTVMSIRYVARYFGLDWKTVKRIDYAHLERRLGRIDLSDVRVIGMDELAIQKGHRYATVIVEPQRKRVLWVGRGRSRADVRPFFEPLGHEGCKAL